MKIWTLAKEMAAQTPASRYRYVDFLRAVSIMVVVTGHWLIAGFLVVGDEIAATQVLATIPETQYLTWLFQVMPIFFVVGGYSNAVSLQSAKNKGQSYAEWLSGRLHRLILPLLALIGFWGLLAILLTLMSVDSTNIQLMTQMALIPIWFLAIYTMVVVLAPVTYKVWDKFSLWSFVALAGFAVLVDVLVLTAGVRWAGWSNYFWVWLAVHQLGYAWQAGLFRGVAMPLVVSILAWVTLAILVQFGPYPLAMVGSPDPDLSNTLPPKLPLLVLGVAQFSLLIAIEGPVNRWLNRLRVWAATVLINSMIMTLYLWHLTVMLLVVYLGWQLGGLGLEFEPGSDIWWLTRPIWILLLFIVLLPVAMLLSAIERSSPTTKEPRVAAAQVIGAIVICSGVASLSMFGLGNAPVAYVDVASVIAVFLGGFISGVFRRSNLSGISS